MSNKPTPLTETLYQYLLDNSLREPDILRRLREETARHEMAQMQIAPDQGQFMAFLAKLLGVKYALEIGVYTGYSSLSVALALPQDGKLIACDINQEWTAIARRYWAEAGVAHKIELHLAPALETLQKLQESNYAGRFDFVFIDADKANYGAYYESALKLLRQGGLMVVDNVLWSGKVADPAIQDESTKSIRNFNKKLANDNRIDLAMAPIGDGLTLARKL